MVYSCSSDVHTYNTRFSDAGNLYVKKSRLSIHLNSFSIFGAKLWNCLKHDLRKLRKKPLKNKIHQFILAVLPYILCVLIGSYFSHVNTTFECNLFFLFYFIYLFTFT